MVTTPDPPPSTSQHERGSPMVEVDFTGGGHNDRGNFSRLVVRVFMPNLLLLTTGERRQVGPWTPGVTTRREGRGGGDGGGNASPRTVGRLSSRS